MSYDSTDSTEKHISRVVQLINIVQMNLIKRAQEHDRSKLGDVEKPIFDEFTCKLKGSTFGSPEYNEFLKEMKVALDHHYMVNDHHPDHFKDGIKGMNLISLLELICDWKAASERHDDGDIMQSLEINQKRFNYSDELKEIFKNTILFFKEQEKN